MMEYFYHNTIRNFTAVFGSLFSSLSIRKDGRRIDVPLHYAGQDKFRYKQDESKSTKGRVKMTLPRMSYEITNFEKDNSRSLNQFNILHETKTIENKTLGVLETQRQKIPYNFSYSVHIKTKTLDEMFQILEQIIIQFEPSVDVLVDGGGFEKDNVKIRLESPDFTDDYQGSFEETRKIETTLHFILEGWLYKAKTDSKIIKHITLNFSSNEDLDPFDLGVVEIDENGNIQINDE